MWEQLSFWASLGPLGRSITLASLGLAVGSFLSVLRHRVPQGQDPLRGRSHCPACHRTLGAGELVPVLSYLMQRGRCRHCQVKISPIYPLLELTAGTMGALGGLFSWSAGFAVLGVLVGVTWMQGRIRARKPAGGFMLVEVVVAFMMLAISLGAVLDLFGIVRHAVPAGYRRTEAVAIARAQYSVLAQGLTLSNKSALLYCIGQRGVQTGEDLLGIPEWAVYEVVVDFNEGASDPNQCVGVTITVACPTCASRYGEALVPVTVRGYLRKRLQKPGVN